MLIESPQMNNQIIDYAAEFSPEKSTNHSFACESAKSINMTAHSVNRLILILVLFLSSFTVSAITLTSSSSADPSNITLSWTRGNDNQFFVYDNDVQIGSTTTSSLNLTNLTLGTHNFQVKGCSSRGCAYPSSYTLSNILTVVIAEPAPPPPPPPSPYPGPASDVSYFYDALGRLVYVTDSKNGNREYELDAAGNRKEVKEDSND
jgi:YD repeat-containing protein